LLAGELGVEMGGVPVLPGFGKAAVFDADDGSAGDLEGLGSGGVAKRGGPVEADAVAFGEGDDRGDVEVRELRAESFREAEKFVGAAKGRGAVVKNRTFREKFEDGFAAVLIPDLFKPAKDQQFVLLESGKRLGRGRHRMPPELEFRRVYRKAGERVNKIFKKNLRALINLWPPLLGAGIRVTRLDADWRAVDVEMKLTRWNRNYVGTHYGGSLYSMTDPFYMVMLIEILGRDYVVWDKSASIRFRKPGKGTVRAEFRLSETQIEEIKEALKKEEKIEREFGIEVKDAEGAVIAEVKKVLHFRRMGKS
jgi:hypothetical protein